MSESESLAHYGVKGMKWGKRKADSPRASNYSDTQRHNDKVDFGARGVQRINDAMVNGSTHKEARSSEKRRRIKRDVAIVAGSAVVYGTLGAIGYGRVMLDTPDGRETLRKGVQFVGTHAKSKPTQAMVMKGARLLDKIYGFKSKTPTRVVRKAVSMVG